MKRLLLTTTICFGLSLSTVHAQVIVNDPLSNGARIMEAGKNLTELKHQYDMMSQQYNGILCTVQSLSHTNGTMNMAKGLLSSEMQNPGSIPPGLPGMGAVTGAERFLNQNKVFTSTGTDFSSRESTRRAQASANIQAQAEEGMLRSQARSEGISELLANIDTQPDVNALAALQARISSEHIFAQNEANHIARLALLQGVGQQVDQQRAEQAGQGQLDEYLNRVQGNMNNAWGG